MNDNVSLIDWISFSLPKRYQWGTGSIINSAPFEPILNDLFNLSTESIEVSRNRAAFYADRYNIYDTNGRPLIVVYLNPTTTFSAETSAVSINGYALSKRNKLLRDLDPVQLIQKVDKHGGKLTRLDLALDIYDHPDLLDNIIECCQVDCFKSRIKSRLRFDRPMVINFGETVYFNRRDDDTQLCFYRKDIQTGSDRPWTRLEFRTKNRKLLANILNEITNGRPVGEITQKLLADYISFYPPETDKYRNPPASWWREIVECGQPFEFRKHDEGKEDDEGGGQGSSSKKPRDCKTVIRYVNDALRFDTGEMLDKLLTDLQQRKVIQDLVY